MNRTHLGWLAALVATAAAFAYRPALTGSRRSSTATWPYARSASGLVTPTSMAFLGMNDLLVAEKNTGRVQRIMGGAVQGTVLDLAVNNASERGLLGLALHPNFPLDPGVYLYWTCRGPGPTQRNARRRR